MGLIERGGKVEAYQIPTVSKKIRSSGYLVE
jgi:hypothetical protein